MHEFEQRWTKHLQGIGAQPIDGARVHDPRAFEPAPPPRPAAPLDQATLALAQTLSLAEQDLLRLAERLQPVLRDVPVAQRGMEAVMIEAECALHRTLNELIRQALELCAGLDALGQRVAL
jgi:hypothetical protein